MLKHPFSNVKVVDLASYIAGALCPGLLADFGAEVIKVESHAGDPFRGFGLTFQDWNRGKRSICIDLKTEAGRGVLYKLVEDADVVVENYRPGVSKRLGADYETLSKINPNLVYCSVSAYGQEGRTGASRASIHCSRPGAGRWTIRVGRRDRRFSWSWPSRITERRVSGLTGWRWGCWPGLGRERAGRWRRLC